MSCVRHDSELGEVRCSRLLCCLDEFIRRRCRLGCHHASSLTSSLTVSSCLQLVDDDLLTSGWQETSLISDTTTIFVYSLLSQFIDECTSHDELRTLVHVCLYLTYAYTGCEISYPLRPFVRGCCAVDRPTDTGQNHNHDEDDDDGYDDDDDDEEDVIIDHASQRRHSFSGSSASSSAYDRNLSDDCRRRFWTCCMSLVHRCSWLMLRLNSDSELYARVYRQLTLYRPTTHSTAVHPSLSREP